MHNIFMLKIQKSNKITTTKFKYNLSYIECEQMPLQKEYLITVLL